MTNICNELTKVQLQARLQRRSIPYAGLKGKEQLVDRLINADAELESKEQLVDGLTEVDVGLIELQSKELLVDCLMEIVIGLQSKEQQIDRLIGADAELQSEEQLVDPSIVVDAEPVCISSNAPRPIAVVPSERIPHKIFAYFATSLCYFHYLLVGDFAIITIFFGIYFMSSNTPRSECLLNCVVNLTNMVSSSEVNGVNDKQNLYVDPSIGFFGLIVVLTHWQRTIGTGT